MKVSGNNAKVWLNGVNEWCGNNVIDIYNSTISVA